MTKTCSFNTQLHWLYRWIHIVCWPVAMPLVTDTKGKVCTVEQLQPKQPICVRSRQYQARCRVETVEEINESTQKL